MLTRVLFVDPEIVEIKGRGSVAVFPVGLTQLRKVKGKVQDLVERILLFRSARDAPPEEMTARMISEFAPTLLEDGVDLIAECCEVRDLTGKAIAGATIADLPHWVIPPVVEAWLRVSFDEEEKRGPWRRAIEWGIARLTGKPASISAIFSQLRSSLATASRASSTPDSPESLIQAGASHSSSSGASELSG
jgi:hypothetical protein